MKNPLAAVGLLLSLAFPAAVAAQAAPPVVALDRDQDGLPDADEDALAASARGDTDGDGTPDRLDVDDDNDDIPTVEEARGRADQDTDGDGRPDHLDADDDGDGVPTHEERDEGISRDSDADGYADHLDADDGAERTADPAIAASPTITPAAHAGGYTCHASPHRGERNGWWAAGVLALLAWRRRRG